MTQIRELSDKIEEELEDAESYIKCAHRYKHHDEELANAYYDLSMQEMQHSNMLHEQGVRLIKEYKAEGHEVPASMQAVYDHLHEKHIERAALIKSMQAQFKE